MTTHTEARSTRFTFAITVAVFVALILGGLIVGTAVWPKARAASAVPGIEISTLMSRVDAAKLPATEIAGPVLKLGRPLN
jgi:hypothetical protein